MKKPRNEIMVGLFVVIGFVMLSLLVFFVSGVYLLRPGYTVNVMYDYVDILDKGAPVRMAGVRIGEVVSVDLLPVPEAGTTRVKIKLYIDNKARIRENYFFEIRGTHILSEPHIEVTPVAGSAPELADGAVVEGMKLVPIEDLIKRVHEIASGLSSIVGGFDEAVGGKKGGSNLKEIMINLAALTKSLEIVMSGSEQDIKKSLKQINSTTDSMNRILDKIENGEGTAGKLLVEDEIYNDLRDFVKDVKAHPWKLLKKDDGKKKFLII